MKFPDYEIMDSFLSNFGIVICPGAGEGRNWGHDHEKTLIQSLGKTPAF